MKSLAHLVMVFSLFAACPPVAWAGVIVGSTFDVDADGWIAREAGGGFNALTYHPTGGNPGGYLNATDIQDARTWYWFAPSKFHGDFSAAYGGTLTFDLREHGGGNQFVGALGDVRLKGDNIVLAFDTLNNPLVGNTWTSYSVPLLETAAGWFIDDLNGPVPTQAQFQKVLASLEILVIRGEYISGGDNGDLDNVFINSPVAAPEPSSLALLAGSLSLLGWFCRGGRRNSLGIAA